MTARHPSAGRDHPQVLIPAVSGEPEIDPLFRVGNVAPTRWLIVLLHLPKGPYVKAEGPIEEDPPPCFLLEMRNNVHVAGAILIEARGSHEEEPQRPALRPFPLPGRTLF